MDKKEAEAIYRRYREGTASPEEKALIESAYLRLADNSPLPDYDRDAVNSLLWSRLNRKARPVRVWYYAAAAAMLVAAATALYFYQRPVVTEIQPGGNRATLTLADGSTIALDSAQSGIVVRDESITYNDGNKVQGVILSANEGSHKPGEATSRQAGTGKGDERASAILQLTTPLGGQYQVMLPDGTKVWLNANSTLRYPAKFTGDQRAVEITGEAFFDIGQKSKQPFIVKSRGQEVRVLGTEFNISAYDEDPVIKTTLVTGSVRVDPTGGHGNPVLLTPGYQTGNTGSGLRKTKADIEAVTAWKNGYFKFNGDLKSVMDQISRWYNVEVTYAPDLTSGMEFSGKIARSMTLNNLCRIISETDKNIHFKLDGRRVMVMN